jgi:ABC-type glycerol-3-phosphate transport system substrate-binding protein
MATTADAEVMMRLYELRREETLRQARRFLVFEFNPKTLEELRAVSRDVKAKENAYWRQAMSYWEMASTFVLRGAVDPDLFLDSNGEGILLYAKFHHFHAVTEKETNNPFMKHTAAVIAKYPAANAMHEVFLKMFGPAKVAS